MKLGIAAEHSAPRRILIAAAGCIAVILCTLFLSEGCARTISAPDAGDPDGVASHAIDFEGISNARDLGGYSTSDGHIVKSGLLIRSGNLDDATDVDIDRMQNDLNVGVICDLRTVGERDVEDPSIDGVENEWLDVDENIRNGIYSFTDSLDTDDGLSGDNISTPYLRMVRAGATEDGGIYDRDMYLRLLDDDQAKNAFRQLFHLLVSSSGDTAVIWHGDTGTHRTGVATMLVLSALGVDENTIVEEYAYSNDQRAATLDTLQQAAEEQGASSDEIDEIMKIAGATPDYMSHTLQEIDSQYGSVQGYLTQELGLTDSDLQMLRDKYLE